ncbi:protein CHROMATIN REMODELING 20 isoform X4 [Cynara cardunculus var. scolymus]|nr:protein CHROMATIN REMODELING 20 isoform X4 [Cynara cardunculus var. scolymus]XP_024988984.1 protein CHROMATIN REMODELING 20 isoform X4 [Cynara cardunculus var. scolymus]
MAADKCEEEEDLGSTSSDSFINDSDNDEPSTSGQDDAMHLEPHLTDEDIEGLIAELLTVESKAAEAQEALEDESLAKVEVEVREELAQSLEGEALESAVAEEMLALRDKWEDELDDLETESAHLLEQLDGAGIELPSLYKWIESQAPNGCCTEAWKNRTHWVGSQVTGDATESIADAEKYLQTHRPVRRHHGKLLEEGASGFLGKRLVPEDDKETNRDVDWSSFNELCSSSTNNTSFGSKSWASVYLASTPQQAAELGLNFPGVDEVEEIDDIEGSLNDPFVADAIVTERELYLSEDHKKNFRKVKEEDDVNIDRKLLFRLNQKRQRKKLKQEGIREAEENDISDDIEYQTSNTEHKSSSDLELRNQKSNGPCAVLSGSKRPSDSVELSDSKKLRAMNTDSADVELVAADGCTSPCSASETLDPSDQQGNGDATVDTNDPNDEFHCTACDKVANEVYTHPLLKVIVCRNCKYLLEEKLKETDPDCSEGFCGWCGKSKDLISCRACKTLFCTSCIKRNLGEDFFLKAQDSGWQCCCCSPSILQPLTSQLEKAFISRSESSSSESDSDDSDDSSESDENIRVHISKRRRKKKIRRILDDAELGEDTKRKIAIEKERQERLKSLEAERLKSLKSMKTDYANFRATVSEGATVDMLGDAQTGYIVNVVREEKEEAVRVPPSISIKLKSHQVAGIRFMWENIIQSIPKVKSGDKGLGCILAHTMGLGKTLQVIAFLYAAMRSVDIGLKAAMIVTPVNVLHNWRHEFTKWRPTEFKPIRVYMLEDVPRDRRLELLMKWRAKGGVFLIGYTNFRNLSLGKHVKDRHMAKEFCRTLQDGPDILVCDEAHMIKNTRADTTQALKQVKCQRRIALTGSPLQNNLMEYYCMVDFVREGFLGSSQEFRNRFQNPIENGQHTNSTSDDVKIMNQRSHILYEQLKGFVQRMDMNVVKKDLPPKTVFVIAVKLSPMQRRLYKRFLDVHGLTNEKASNEKTRKSFFASYQALAQIWNHPGILQLMKDKDFSKRENFLVEDSSSDDILDYTMANRDKLRNRNDISSRKNVSGFFKENWWDDLLQENGYEAENSGKMVLLLEILSLCYDAGDKALVFSQSLPTLDLIERHLSKLTRTGKSRKCWKKGKDWYRLDGRTEGSERQKLVEKFNDPSNKRVKCTLISTRAGSLGINLYAANRVIIVDGSWNPTYDLQAIYRAWRYGQTKPVFAYRLMAHGTMEEKIYKRQVTKESLSARVVDRQQVHRTISKEEMLHLFAFGDEENLNNSSKLDQVVSNVAATQSTGEVGNSSKPKSPLPHATISSDKFMEVLLSKHHPRPVSSRKHPSLPPEVEVRWIANYHEHESLLQENEDEKLSKEEQDMAWEVYRRTLEWEEVQRNPVDGFTTILKPTMNGISEVKPPVQPQLTTKKPPAVTRVCSRNRFVLRKCTNLAHMLTLRSQGVKSGCSTICGECGQEISWNGLNK